MTKWLGKIDDSTYGIYLENNTPFFSKTNITDSTDLNVNPFATLPLWPGTSSAYSSSLPTFAMHVVDYDKKSGTVEFHYHLDIHNLYGDIMAQ